MNIKVIKNNRTGGWLTKVEIETINKLENVRLMLQRCLKRNPVCTLTVITRTISTPLTVFVASKFVQV